MSILKDALNGLSLEDLKRECNPKETVEIKIYWQLEDLDRLGRPVAYLKKLKIKNNAKSTKKANR